jgi:hypothetical protein
MFGPEMGDDEPGDLVRGRGVEVDAARGAGLEPVGTATRMTRPTGRRAMPRA